MPHAWNKTKFKFSRLICNDSIVISRYRLWKAYFQKSQSYDRGDIFSRVGSQLPITATMKSNFNLGLWDYSVSRKVTVGSRLLLILWIFSLGYATLVVLLVLAGDEFEYKVQPPTADYNATVKLWYQPFIPHVLKNYTKDAWICSPNILTLGDCTSVILMSLLMSRSIHQ